MTTLESCQAKLPDGPPTSAQTPECQVLFVKKEVDEKVKSATDCKGADYCPCPEAVTAVKCAEGLCCGNTTGEMIGEAEQTEAEKAKAIADEAKKM